ncbi:minor capsid protein [Paenibacillus periandrae]|uniref:minor capsid protein n=1 Tax=Paenibacillus periandrae TaxID=1761741 RepID=UPI001F0932D8|nr:minor capsid protein [Paenibacillus periandrae]
MKSPEYWAKRFEMLSESQLNKGEAYANRTDVEYKKAMAKIKKDTDAWYQRLAKNNDVSVAGARKLLKANELEEFKWDVKDYIKAGRENAIDQRWMKQLENASAKVHISRLEAQQLQMRQHIEMLSASKQAGTKELLGGIYKDSYYKSIFELQKGFGVGASFAKLDDRQLDMLLSRPWAADGAIFSSRIWKDKVKLLNELDTTLIQSLIRGDPSDQMIKAFADRMGVSMRDARRLVMTETAYFSGQATLDGYRELGVEEYQFMATLDRKTSNICRAMDLKIFPMEEARAGVNYPPLHAHCRSTTVPHYEDNITERIARGADGKTYMVPGDMNYEQWAAKYAEDAKKPPKLAPPIQVDPPKVTQKEANIPPEGEPPVPAPFVPAKSLQAAETAAKRDYGFEVADYTGLDLESANSMNRAIDKAMENFPSIKGFAKEIKAVDTEDFVAQAGLTYEGGMAFANLKISTRYYNSSDIDDIIKASVDAKHWPIGSTKESLFVHEFGHLLEYAHAMKVMGAWTGAAISVDDAQVIWSRITKGLLSQAIMAEALANLGIKNTAQNIIDELSNYANKNTKEFLAEAFAEAIGTANPRRLALEVINILKRKLKEAGM